MDWKFCVQIISRENTNFGRILFQALLGDLYYSKIVDELIIVDNGNAPYTKNMLKEVKPIFEGQGTVVKIIDHPARVPFFELRNMALRAMDPKTDYWMFLDTDEDWNPNLLNSVVGVLKQSKVQGKMFDKVMTHFYHHMVDPSLYQYIEWRFNIFKNVPTLRWEKEVHEHVVGFENEANNLDSGAHYNHYGYCKQQFLRCLIWLHYARLEHGNLNCYKEELVGTEPNQKVEQYFREWRNPNSILDDRLPVSKPYTETYPPGTDQWRMIWKQSGLPWREWLATIDPETEKIWETWKALYKTYGNWSNTLDPMLEWYEETDGTI